MTDHPIQHPLDRKVKKGWRSRVAGSPSLLFSLLLHIIFALLAGYYIVSRTQEKRRPQFAEVTVSAVSPKLDQKVQLMKMQSAQSAPSVSQRIMTTDLSSVNLPEVTMPSDATGEGSAKMGAAVIGGSGDSKSGVGGGGAPIDVDLSIIAPAFGFTENNGLGLPGRFYDLKQTRNGEHTKAFSSNEAYYSALYTFITDGFAKKDLQTFFQAQKSLYLPQLFIPYRNSADAPAAFDVEKQVQPSYWIALYQGKFQVPQGGTFRFVGFADNLVEVMVDGKLVLNAAGWQGKPLLMEKLNHPATDRYTYDFPVKFAQRSETEEKLSFVGGDWMHFEDNSVHEIKILIGDDNGITGFWLMVQEKYHTYALTPQGSPILPLFQVSNVKMADTIGCPPFDQKKPIIWPLASNDDSSDDTAAPEKADDTAK